MLIIPAIDLRGGRCVRLYQGRRDRETVFSGDPVGTARRWVDQGAGRLHVVDLDGAFEGESANLRILEAIAGSVPVPVQFGGGVRDREALRRAFDAGAAFVILGTVLHRDPAFSRAALRDRAGRIILGIDAREGRVAVSGWEEGTEVEAADLARRYEPQGPAAVVFTDISRDGALGGPNVEATRALARAVSTPVIASGGVSSLEDIASLLPLEADGVRGVIAGRALYEGKLDLARAVELAGC
ncbi:MAG: 1-(5-phosphoribosyl)-5-[(5-phosphoribosylamino)methylideneamino]imidazole-4-carboxamide isomerase [Nitrospinota bacterium]